MPCVGMAAPLQFFSGAEGAQLKWLEEIGADGGRADTTQSRLQPVRVW